MISLTRNTYSLIQYVLDVQKQVQIAIDKLNMAHKSLQAEVEKTKNARLPVGVPVVQFDAAGTLVDGTDGMVQLSTTTTETNRGMYVSNREDDDESEDEGDDHINMETIAKMLKKLQKQKSSSDEYDHEVATCDASFSGVWTGFWEPCSVIKTTRLRYC